MRELFADFSYQGDFLVCLGHNVMHTRFLYTLIKGIKCSHSKMIPNCLKKHQPVPVQCISEIDGYSICAGCFDTIM